MRLFVVILLNLVLFFSVSSQIQAAAPTQELRILTVNDFHGAILASGKNPGLARLAAQIEEIRTTSGAQTLLLSAGDMFQGSLDSNLTYGALTMDFMNEMKFEAMVLGNHEFDWGIDVLKQRIAQAKFPVLCANLIDKQTGQTPNWILPYVILEKNGLKIAILGLTTPDTIAKTRPHVLESYTIEAPEQTVARLLPQIKAQRPDVIILLTHLDSEQDRLGAISGSAADLIHNLPDSSFDAVISGHSHREVAGMINGISLVQAGAYGQNLGELRLLLTTPEHKIMNKQQRVIPIFRQGPESTALKQSIDSAEQNLLPLRNRVLGYNNTTLKHSKYELSPLGQWVTDEMRRATHCEIAFLNGGALRTSLDQGPVTLGKLYEILPFDNEVYTMELTGQQIKDLIRQSLNSKTSTLQYSGLEVTLDPKQQLYNVTLLNSQKMKNDQLYRVALTDFLAEGGDGYELFMQGKNPVHTGWQLRDCLSQDLEKAKILDFEADQRLLIWDDAA